MSTQTATRRPESQFRAFSFEGHGVDIEMRADKTGEGDGRTFRGIAVPWDVEIDVDGWVTEVWRSGAFNHQFTAARRVLAGRGHIPLGGEAIGALSLMRNDAKGLYVEGRISKTPMGDNTLTLVEDKVLRELSIGFYDVPEGALITRRANGAPHVEYRKANLFEVAILEWGAYGGKATVQGLRGHADGRSVSLRDANVADIMGELARRAIANQAAPDLRAAPDPGQADPDPEPDPTPDYAAEALKRLPALPTE